MKYFSNELRTDIVSSSKDFGILIRPLIRISYYCKTKVFDSLSASNVIKENKKVEFGMSI